jgi:hypothetical protein
MVLDLTALRVERLLAGPEVVLTVVLGGHMVEGHSGVLAVAVPVALLCIGKER